MIRNAVFVGVAVAALTAPVRAQTSVYDLRTEHLSNPLGIDEPKPRFSWKMKSDEPGAGQRAYQVQVATTTESLTSGKPDLWDSGPQETSASQSIVYGGPGLKPRSFYVWRVKVWDQDGKELDFSAPASWETGQMARDQWKGTWIAGEYDRSSKEADLSGIRWIWYPEGNPAKQAEKGPKYLRHRFELSDKKIRSAKAWCLIDDTGTVFLNGQRAFNPAGFQGFADVDISSHLKAGENTIQVEAVNAGNNPAGLAIAIDVEYEDGSKERIVTDKSWQAAKVSGSDWPDQDAAAKGDAEWVEALEMGEIGMKPWNKPHMEVPGAPASLLRKDFEAAEKPSRARLYITALGSYRAEINGQRVGNDVLTPDWTDYRKRVTYQTYDVTSLVKSGENAIGVILGDGWYGSALGWALEPFNFGPPPTRLLAELHLDYPSGKTDVVASDKSWKTAQSPILRSELYYGEIYDAREEKQGWSQAGFDASSWKSANEPDTSPAIELNNQAMPPIRVRQQIKPIAITEPARGVFVYDMGQNMVGWVQLKVKGKAGDTVRLRFAEILKDDGNIYRENLRRAEATDTYILKGDGEELFEPHFTYHGFRYVEVTGYPGGKPDKDAITGQVFHTDLEQAGKFESSDAMVNQIVKNTQWGIWGNLHSVPTDCPQRDERLGWTGDAEAIWKTACYLMDMRAFTEKWCADLRDAQGEEGDYPNVAPRVISTNTGAPGWGDAGIILPYQAWLMYGDKRLLEEMWDSMEAWMRFIHAANPNYLWQNRRGNDYGDWVPANSTTDKELVATAFWAGDARMMAEMAGVLGKADKVKEYEELYGKIRNAFQDRFIKEDGTIANGSQTCYVLALENGLVQPDMQQKAIGKLLDDIKARNNHLSTGFLGTTHLLPVLTKSSQNPVAVMLLLNKTYPSWGYMISKGATTIWERWNGDKGDPSMNSFNHFNYGAVVDWIYGYLGGIRPASAGFEQILLEPHPDKRLQWVNTSYESAYGPVVSNWKYRGDDLTWTVEVPPNTTAKISLPTEDPAKAKLDGKAIPADMQPTQKDGRVVLDAKPGKYEFVVSGMK